MENTPYQRLELFWQSLGMKKASAFIDTVPGLTAAALSAMKQRGSKPSASIMRAIQVVYETLNPDYILWGEGEMTNEATEGKPQSTFGDDVEATVLRALLADKEKTIREQAIEIAKLNRELGKSSDSSDAADDLDDDTEAPLDPKGPLGRGVQLMLRPKRVRGLWRAADDVAELS